MIQLFRSIGKNVQRLRETKNLTQTEFAKYCRLSRSQILRAESGRGEVRLNTLAQIARANEIPLTQLISEQSISIRFVPFSPTSATAYWSKDLIILKPGQIRELDLEQNGSYLVICLIGELQLYSNFENTCLTEKDGCFIEGTGKVELRNSKESLCEVLTLRKAYRVT